MRTSLLIIIRVTGLLAAAIAVLALTSSMATAAVPAWTTYDHDGARSGTDPDSAAPTAPTAAWGAPAQLDGSVWSEPLVYGSLVYVATENDTIYALNAATGAVVWQRSVGAAVPSGDLPCGDISPTVGITSTPAIDPALGRIYAVADVLTGGTAQHQLVALNLATGAPVAGFPVAVDPPGDAPTAILQRGSLALSGGRVIIPYGGNDGDCGTYHGWLVSKAQDGTGALTTFEVDPGSGEHGGAIWGSGDGPSVDSAGHVFVETGNGFGSTTPDLQESVVELDPQLDMLAHWTPSNWKTLDDNDTDLGSAEPLPLPGGLLFVAGKDGVGRLISATALGTTGQVFSAPVCSSGGVYGASLYRAGVIYVPCSGGLTAVSLSSSGTSFTTLAGFSAPAGASGPPIFASGLVWSTGWRSTGILYGLDPATGGIRFQTTLGTFAHFATPSAGGGRLFAAAGTKLSALTISTFPPGTATTLAASADRVTAGMTVRLTATVAPAPDGGTVAFTQSGAVIPGCAAVSVAASSGQATCPVTPALGSHPLQATYAGDAYFGASTSAPLTEVVTARPGRARLQLTRVRLSAHRFTARHGATLSLSLSQAATVHVVLSRALGGRTVRRRCRVGARHGARCTVRRRARRFRFAGRAGRNRRRLNFRGLTAGRYVATVIAVSANRLKSRTVTIRCAILRRRR
ncbi:MAG TPA: Ig-like domain repeat protein [Solirubrobacteraceae bacterium]